MHSEMIDTVRANLWVFVAGGIAVVAAVLGQAAILWVILSPAKSGDWVLFAIPACGLLGFAGIGTILTGFFDR